VKQKDGNYNYQGATPNDLKLMRETCGPAVQVKAAGGVRTYEEAVRVRDLGATRIGASATEAIVAGERAANGQAADDEETVESVGY
jgi:deoxyribose-phosphate aldolase